MYSKASQSDHFSFETHGDLGIPHDLRIPDGRKSSAQGKAFTLPNDVFDRLYGYQREGVAWMAKLMSRQHGGGAWIPQQPGITGQISFHTGSSGGKSWNIMENHGESCFYI